MRFARLQVRIRSFDVGERVLIVEREEVRESVFVFLVVMVIIGNDI